MIEFKQVNKQRVEVIKNGKTVGKIFTPSGAGENIVDGIQICGFSEAFDFWGCGPFAGFKDINLLFSGKEMGGERIEDHTHDRIRCYRKPCQCDNKEKSGKSNPFKVKRLEEVVAGEL